MTALQPAEMARLRKVAALLDSPVDGEAMAALGRVRKMVHGAGLKVADMLVLAPPRQLQPIPVPPSSLFTQKAMRCASLSELFNDWERDFIDCMSLVRSPSDRQRATLEKLYRRVCDAAEQAA